MFRVTLLLLLCTTSLQADEPLQQEAKLTLEKIMADPDWVGRAPENPTWSDDGSQVFYQRKHKGNQVRDWFRVSPDGGKAVRLKLANIHSDVPRAGADNRTHSRTVYSNGGDLFVRNTKNGNVVQLTRTAANESAPRFLHNENRISFRRDGVLLVRDLKSGMEFQPAIVKTEDPPDETDSEESAESFLTQKEAELFEYLNWQEALQDAAKARKKKLQAASPAAVDETWYLGKGQTIVSQRLSPNGRWLAVVLARVATPEQSGRQDKMAVWVNDDAYVASRDVRRLVGDQAEPPQRILLLDLKRHKKHAIPLDSLPDITTDRLVHLNSMEDTDQEADGTGDAKPRDVTIRGVEFSSDSSFLLFQCFSTDNKDRWIVTIAPKQTKKDGGLTVLHHRYDEAWINWGENVAGWIPGSHRVYLLSEASGFSHLYVGDAANGKTRQLTSGQFEVSSPQLSRDARTIYFRSNATHPGVYEFNSVDLASGETSSLTELGGMNTFELSPDETRVVAVHSELNMPPELVMVDLSVRDKTRQLTHTTTRKFRDVEWTVPQIVEVPSRHGQTIYSRLYLPAASTEDTAPRQAVVFVHGAGYLQNSHQGWSGYFREFMFHTLLTRRGYVVLDMDYRASAGYGRDWRTAIYRQMGTPELEDLEDGVDWLVEHHNVDRHRIGVYGGSYGGFMTLMALFKTPDLFACGAALRPVTDWAHYNHGYTSNILNTPETDPTAYERSSPIYYADGLQAPLLICHGMVDDNVFFKDTVRLTQKLIELHKKDWNVAMYPVEPHGFRHPDSWLDEYRRVLELFETHLK
jgi:dipeptidyl aminopeptidase/acylaminoacyl peptidase